MTSKHRKTHTVAALSTETKEEEKELVSSSDNLNKSLVARHENVRVIIRFRPINSREKKEEKNKNFKKLDNIGFGKDNNGYIKVPYKNKQQFSVFKATYDNILKQSSTQKEAFISVAESACDDILEGYNATIFAYGQTGAGKTFTMYGPENNPTNKDNMGIIPRSVTHIFSKLTHPESKYNKNSDDSIKVNTFHIQICFLEIYQEKLRDLLNSKNKPKIKLMDNLQYEIVNVEKKTIDSIKDLVKWLTIASNNRTQAATSMNKSSSRSHMLLRLYVTIETKDGRKRTGIGNFADLAGSEKVRKTEAKGQRLKEAQKINLSLSQLSLVIKKLSEGANFVPYNNSLLTKVLRDSLGGNCKTTLVVACSPHSFNRDETISSLRFGKQCKFIKNKATINMKWTSKQYQKEIDRLNKIIIKLEKDIKNITKNTIKQLNNNQNETNENTKLLLENQEKEIKELKYKLEVSNINYNKKNDEYNELDNKYDLLNKEKLSLNKELQDKLLELENYKQLEKKLIEKGKELNLLKQENDKLKTELDNKNNVLKTKDIKINELSSNIDNLKHTITDNNESIQLYKNEIDSLNKINETNNNKLVNEITKSENINKTNMDQLRKLQNNLNSLQQQYKLKNIENDTLKLKYNQSNEKNIKITNDCNLLQNKYNILNDKYDKLKLENNSLNDRIKNLITELDNMKLKNEEKNNIIHNKNEEIEKHSITIETIKADYKIKLSDNETNIKQLNNKLDEYKKDNDKLTKENNELRLLLNNNLQKMEDTKKQLNIKNLQILNKESETNELERQAQMWKNAYEERRLEIIQNDRKMAQKLQREQLEKFKKQRLKKKRKKYKHNHNNNNNNNKNNNKNNKNNKTNNDISLNNSPIKEQPSFEIRKEFKKLIKKQSTLHKIEFETGLFVNQCDSDESFDDDYQSDSNNNNNKQNILNKN